MSRKIHTLGSIACASLLAATSGYAGESSGMQGSDTNSRMHEQMQQSEQPMGTGMSHQASAPDLSQSYRSGQLIGMNVRNRENQELGEISQLILDRSGRVTHVVLSRGGVLGVGGKGYVVPWDRIDIKPDQQRATLDIPASRISSEFSAFEPLKEQDKTRMQQESQQQETDQ